MKDRKVTRAQAQRVIAGTTDLEVIGGFSKHPNKHIRAYVAHKTATLEGLALKAEKRRQAAAKAAATRAAKKAAKTQQAA